MVDTQSINAVLSPGSFHTLCSRVHSKLVEHCSVTLEGICTSKETAFKLGSLPAMNVIVHG